MPESAHVAWEPLGSMLDWWDVVSRASDIWWRRRGGKPAIDAVAHERFGKLVQFARTHSAFYRDRYGHLPEPDIAAGRLPVVRKGELMARFDDWVTDPAVARAGVDAFLADRTQSANAISAATSSGKARARRAARASLSRMRRDRHLRCPHRHAVRRHRTRSTVRRGFCSPRPAGARRHRRDRRAFRDASRRGGGSCGRQPVARARSLSVLGRCPAGRRVERIPAGVRRQLSDDPLPARRRKPPAGSRSARRACGRAANISRQQRSGIERAFGCPVANEYGASECMSIAFGCRAGWLHVNADWVILEPVDRDYRPTPPGHPSHSVPAHQPPNRIQPVIRYDLGDSVTVERHALRVRQSAARNSRGRAARRRRIALGGGRARRAAAAYGARHRGRGISGYPPFPDRSGRARPADAAARRRRPKPAAHRVERGLRRVARLPCPAVAAERAGLPR